MSFEKLYTIEPSKKGWKTFLPVFSTPNIIMGVSTADYDNIAAAESSINLMLAVKESDIKHSFDPDYLHKKDILLSELELPELIEEGNSHQIESRDNEFLVHSPGLIWYSRNVEVANVKRFKSWTPAKNHFLSQTAKKDAKSKDSTCNIDLDGKVIQLTQFQNFNPAVSKTNITYSTEILEQLFEKTDENGSKTYDNTAQTIAWKESVFKLIIDHMDSPFGKFIQGKYAITDIRNLSPKQAIGISNDLVVNLKQYDTQENDDYSFVEADVKNTMDLLQEGLEKGSFKGVCRNISNVSKAIFEAIKSNQVKFNQLSNTYCISDSGSEFEPKKSTVGHAWPSYVVVMPDASLEISSLDSTWHGVDVTLPRFESKARKLATKPGSLDSIINYYELMLSDDTSSKGISKEDKQVYYTKQFAQIIIQNKDIKSAGNLTIPVTSYLSNLEDLNESHVELAWRLNGELGINTTTEVIDNYVNQTVGKYMASFFFENPNLQLAVIDSLKTNHTESYINEITTGGKGNGIRLRAKIRELNPEELGEFSPVTNSADALELNYLISWNNVLESKLGYAVMNNNEPQVKLDKVNEILTDLNPIKFAEIKKTHSTYSIVKDFNNIYSSMND